MKAGIRLIPKDCTLTGKDNIYLNSLGDWILSNNNLSELINIDENRYSNELYIVNPEFNNNTLILNVEKLNT